VNEKPKCPPRSLEDWQIRSLDKTTTGRKRKTKSILNILDITIVISK
jgi:hypothetical protein